MPLEPPREVRLEEGVLSWKAPANTESVSHYRIYRNNEHLLVREISSGQLFLADNLYADRLFISSYNKPLNVESMRLLIPGPIYPPLVDLATGVKGILHILNGGTSADSAEMAAETLNFYPKEYVDLLEERIVALEEGSGGVGAHTHSGSDLLIGLPLGDLATHNHLVSGETGPVIPTP
jgi:hypothetical protein